MTTTKTMTTDRIYAALSPASGLLMYAERRPDLATAIAEYSRLLGASPRDAAAGVTWYRLPADTEIDHWDDVWSDEQEAEWTAAEPRQIPEHLVWVATGEAPHRAEVATLFDDCSMEFGNDYCDCGRNCKRVAR